MPMDPHSLGECWDLGGGGRGSTRTAGPCAGCGAEAWAAIPAPGTLHPLGADTGEVPLLAHDTLWGSVFLSGSGGSPAHTGCDLKAT